MPTVVPQFQYTVPTLGHPKDRPYIDFPLVYNETVTNRVFYVQHPFTFVTSDAANTSLYKWNGGGWTEVTGWDNPEKVYGFGFFSVTTAANAYVSISEHVNELTS